MRRRILPILLMVTCALAAWGYEQDKLKGYELNFSAGLYTLGSSDPAWSLEPEFLWRFHKYLGASLGLEITRQYGTSSRSTTIDGHPADLVENEEAVGWMILKPAMVLRSPNLWSNAKEEKNLWLEAAVGVSLACPFRNSLTYAIKEFEGGLIHTIGYRKFHNKGLRWFYFNTMIQLKYSVDRLIFGAGYYWSDLDYYSGRRNITLANGNKFHVPKRQNSQIVFLMIGYKF